MVYHHLLFESEQTQTYQIKTFNIFLYVKKKKKYYKGASQQHKIHRQIFHIQHSVIKMISKNMIRR